MLAKKIEAYLLEFFTIVGITLCILFIITCQINRFYNSLYINTSLLMARHIFLMTLQRVGISIMLYTMGIACMLLCAISYESKDFLRCSRIFLLASGFVASIWDYEFVFYTNPQKALLWSRIGDVCLILFVICIYNNLISQCRPINAPLLIKANCLFGSISSVIVFILNQKQMLFILKLFWGYILFFAILIMAVIIKEQQVKGKLIKVIGKTENVIFILCSLFLSFMTYLVAFHKFQTLTKAYDFYKDVLPYGLVVFIMLFFLQFIQYHRTGLLFGGEANHKLREIEKYKEEVSNSLISCCFTPINNMLFYSRKLIENETTYNEQLQKEMHRGLETEIYRLKQQLVNANSFQLKEVRHAPSIMIKINLPSLLHYAGKLVAREWKISNAITLHVDKQIGYVMGEPYSLIQAMQTILSTMYDIHKAGEPMTINSWMQDDKTIVQITAIIQDNQNTLAKRMKKILESKKDIQRLVYDEDIALYNARNSLQNHNANPSVMLNRQQPNEILVTYSLEKWVGGKENNSISKPEQQKEDKQKKVVLLSTSTEQIEIMQMYLKHEPYTFHSFYTEEDAVKYIERHHNIAVVIIGNLFFGYTLQGICERIREIYTMECLPILVVCQNKYWDIDKVVLENFNDILVEPFEQMELMQKIYLLESLQKSAEESLKAKVDFLQSQMDPHFVFNTLSSIMPLCIQDPQKAYQVMNDFSDYLRGRLFPKELHNPIPIYEEIDIAEAFLSIERVRFPNKILYQIDTDYNEENVILPLLVEPIIENCVKHGMKLNSILHVYIGIKERDGFVYFTVKDDGKGMNRDQLKKITYEEYVSSRSIGLANVKKRLMLYYHERICIVSRENYGTEVSFKIPANTSIIIYKN